MLFRPAEDCGLGRRHFLVCRGQAFVVGGEGIVRLLHILLVTNLRRSDQDRARWYLR